MLPNRPSYRLSALLALAALALTAVLLLIPVPVLGRAGNALLDMIHAPLFAVLGAFAYALFVREPSRHRWLAVLAIGLVLATLGVAAELLQARVGRNASLQDAFSNVVGTVAGLLWISGRHNPHAGRRGATRIAVAGLILAAYTHPLLTLMDVSLAHRNFPQLSSFEQPLELSRWKPWHARLSRSRQHATDGEWSLRIDGDVTKYSAATLFVPPRDWSPYTQLVLDIARAGPPTAASAGDVLRVFVKVQDQQHNDRSEDRFQQLVELRPGQAGEIRIPLLAIASAPRDRVMDLSRIDKLEIFTVRAPHRWTLYLDNLRLE